MNLSSNREPFEMAKALNMPPYLGESTLTTPETDFWRGRRIRRIDKPGQQRRALIDDSDLCARVDRQNRSAT